MEQVKFTCKMEGFQKDATGAVVIGAYDSIADPIFNLDLIDHVELV